MAEVIIVAAVVIYGIVVVWKKVKDIRTGKGCGCGCSDCPHKCKP